MPFIVWIGKHSHLSSIYMLLGMYLHQVSPDELINSHIGRVYLTYKQKLKQSNEKKSDGSIFNLSVALIDDKTHLATFFCINLQFYPNLCSHNHHYSCL